MRTLTIIVAASPLGLIFVLAAIAWVKKRRQAHVALNPEWDNDPVNYEVYSPESPEECKPEVMNPPGPRYF